MELKGDFLKAPSLTVVSRMHRWFVAILHGILPPGFRLPSQKRWKHNCRWEARCGREIGHPQRSCHMPGGGWPAARAGISRWARWRRGELPTLPATALLKAVRNCGGREGCLWSHLQRRLTHILRGEEACETRGGVPCAVSILRNMVWSHPRLQAS